MTFRSSSASSCFVDALLTPSLFPIAKKYRIEGSCVTKPLQNVSGSFTQIDLNFKSLQVRQRNLPSPLLKSVFYKSTLENPSANKIFTIRPHILGRQKLFIWPKSSLPRDWRFWYGVPRFPRIWFEFTNKVWV